MSTMTSFLDRTIRLIKEELTEAADDTVILDALRGTRVLILADSRNAQSHSAQTAIVSTALLLARCGIDVHIDVPDLPLVGPQPPVTGAGLASSLWLYSSETKGMLRIAPATLEEYDLVLALGDSSAVPYAAPTELRLNCSRWAGLVGTRSPWPRISEPFGAMATAAMASTEGFKLAMRRLRSYARHSETFDRQFRCRTTYAVRLAPDATVVPKDLGMLDIVSGGAVTNAIMYSLFRIPDVRGRLRVIEPQCYDETNHNRCMLMRPDSSGEPKALDLSRFATPLLTITPIPAAFEDALTSGALDPLSEYILVGVDNIPTRWRVQRAAPYWIGVGATTHWSAMSSFHIKGGPCAGCSHPRDDSADGEAPTISFVSFWAGLWTAAYFVRQLGGDLGAAKQVFLTPTAMAAEHGIWESRVLENHLCPLHASAA